MLVVMLISLTTPSMTASDFRFEEQSISAYPCCQLEKHPSNQAGVFSFTCHVSYRAKPHEQLNIASTHS